MNWYIENHSQAYYKAVELSRLLQDIINYSDADKTEYIIRKAAELGMSQRTCTATWTNTWRQQGGP